MQSQAGAWGCCSTRGDVREPGAALLCLLCPSVRFSSSGYGVQAWGTAPGPWAQCQEYPRWQF